MRLCQAGLHDLDKPENVLKHAGKRPHSECRLCAGKRSNEYRKKKWAQDEMWRNKINQSSSKRNRYWRENNPRTYAAALSFSNLKSSTEEPILNSGWPDAYNTEQKVGTDRIKKNQWVRFAWLKKHKNLDVRICLAPTIEDIYDSSKRIVYRSVSGYIRGEFGSKIGAALILWKKLQEAV